MPSYISTTNVQYHKIIHYWGLLINVCYALTVNSFKSLFILNLILQNFIRYFREYFQLNTLYFYNFPASAKFDWNWSWFSCLRDVDSFRLINQRNLTLLLTNIPSNWTSKINSFTVFVVIILRPLLPTMVYYNSNCV